MKIEPSSAACFFKSSPIRVVGATPKATSKATSKAAPMAAPGAEDTEAPKAEAPKADSEAGRPPFPHPPRRPPCPPPFPYPPPPRPCPPHLQVLQFLAGPPPPTPLL